MGDWYLDPSASGGFSQGVSSSYGYSQPSSTPSTPAATVATVDPTKKKATAATTAQSPLVAALSQPTTVIRTAAPAKTTTRVIDPTASGGATKTTYTTPTTPTLFNGLTGGVVGGALGGLAGGTLTGTPILGAILGGLGGAGLGDWWNQYINSQTNNTGNPNYDPGKTNGSTGSDTPNPYQPITTTNTPRTQNPTTTGGGTTTTTGGNTPAGGPVIVGGDVPGVTTGGNDGGAGQIFTGDNAGNGGEGSTTYTGGPIAQIMQYLQDQNLFNPAVGRQAYNAAGQTYLDFLNQGRQTGYTPQGMQATNALLTQLVNQGKTNNFGDAGSSVFNTSVGGNNYTGSENQVLSALQNALMGGNSITGEQVTGLANVLRPATTTNEVATIAGAQGLNNMTTGQMAQDVAGLMPLFQQQSSPYEGAVLNQALGGNQSALDAALQNRFTQAASGNLDYLNSGQYAPSALMDIVAGEERRKALQSLGGQNALWGGRQLEAMNELATKQTAQKQSLLANLLNQDIGAGSAYAANAASAKNTGLNTAANMLTNNKSLGLEGSKAAAALKGTQLQTQLGSQNNLLSYISGDKELSAKISGLATDIAQQNGVSQQAATQYLGNYLQNAASQLTSQAQQRLAEDFGNIDRQMQQASTVMGYDQWRNTYQLQAQQSVMSMLTNMLNAPNPLQQLMSTLGSGTGLFQAFSNLGGSAVDGL